MLYKDPFIIAPKTYQLIQELQAMPYLKDFHLVGGTALALQLGHRNSIDIDLFTQINFDDFELVQVLTENYNFKEIFKRKNTIISLIDNIKTDFIRHAYPFIKPPITEEGIRLLGLEDIAAMKLHAIVQSGKRLKDFIDIYFILQHHTMAQIVGYYEEKYMFSNAIVALKALNYFDDIDVEMDPPKMITYIPIADIKERIQSAILNPYITF